MKIKIKYYRRYQIIIGGNDVISQYACVICKQNKGKCIPFSNLEQAKKGVDFLLNGIAENKYCINDTKLWRR
jgi:hypothetical protein